MLLKFIFTDRLIKWGIAYLMTKNPSNLSTSPLFINLRMRLLSPVNHIIKLFSVLIKCKVLSMIADHLKVNKLIKPINMG